MLCHPSDSLNLVRLISTQNKENKLLRDVAAYWTPPPPLTTTQYRNTSGPGPSGGQKGLRSQSQLPSARRTPHKNIRTLMLSSSIIFSSCFSTRPTHQTFESTVSSDHQCETHEVMIIRLCISHRFRLSTRNRSKEKCLDAYCEKLLYSESEIDSMRLSFPLDSVARSMGLAPKVTSMGKMNVSANFGGDKLKTVIYQIDEIDKLKAGVLVGLVWVTRGQLISTRTTVRYFVRNFQEVLLEVFLCSRS
ncbi:hypothetical protein YC2023_108910 [Brassica napus]